MTPTTCLDPWFSGYESAEAVWTPSTRSFRVPGFDTRGLEADLKEALKSDGIDMEDLLRDASVHFQAPKIVPFSGPIDPDQLEEIAIDELGAWD